MSEKKIRLRILEDRLGAMATRFGKSFVITIDDDGNAEIRHESAPVVDRDTSCSIAVGKEPNWDWLTLRVEQIP